MDEPEMPNDWMVVGIFFGTPHLFRELRRVIILEAVRKCGDEREAARALGISLRSVRRYTAEDK